MAQDGPDADSPDTTESAPAGEAAQPSGLGSTDNLPWKEESGGASAISRRPRNPAEMLKLFDIDESILRPFIDGRRLEPEEADSMIQILNALPQFSARDREKWAAKEVDWEKFEKEPEEHRTEMAHIEGIVTNVEPIPLIPEAAKRFGFARYYKAEVDLLNIKDTTFIVFSRKIPRAWKLGSDMKERVSFNGMFLKWDDQERMVWATDRIAWHPWDVNPELGIETEGEVFLASLGMDFGLFDDVTKDQPLTKFDREPFYQMLAAVQRTKAKHLHQRADKGASAIDMISKPSQFQGRLLRIDGVARRATKVMVEDKDVQERFGIDHYYEVYVFVELDRVISDGAGDNAVQFLYEYPFVICCRELPKGMEEGDKIYVPVSVPAFYFKRWEYDTPAKRAGRTLQIDEDGKEVEKKTLGQRSPMLIALRPTVVKTESGLSLYTGAMFGGLFAAAVIGVWIGVWHLSRGDKKFERETLSRQRGLEEGASLNEMGIEAEGPPDFSHLAEADVETASASKTD